MQLKGSRQLYHYKKLADVSTNLKNDHHIQDKMKDKYLRNLALSGMMVTK